ncbi:glycosyl transferase family 1 [Maribacter vaceletii]|uniref:Glycosyl transferase family 1 n=1 Tax=Maribacter vaceletii TaxID=1206816 RepID=A0A495E8U6_9FLAO|nr:glycosyltransferase family 4 protein [Maribacter vaceletii]RKR12999.1 glycosyl transferase family 1 [Maribacter vaceletii]
MKALNILIIGFVWPEPTTTAAGQRMLELIHFFLKQDCNITFASTAKKNTFSYPLDSLGVAQKEISLNDSGFDLYLSDNKKDIVIFDRYLTEEQFGWRVAENNPEALRILDTEDLHSLRNTRENAFKKGVPFTIENWKNNSVTKREIASIYRSDVSLIISSYEMQLLTKELNINNSLLHHLPFLLKAKKVKKIPFEEREEFICIGNGNHAPNKDAVIWLKKEIWPLIRKQLPEAMISIYGGHLPEQILQMHNPNQGFLVKGWAPSAIEVMRKARVNLAPLRFGAGLKGKLITALQANTPSVTTAIGAEGFSTKHLELNGTIAETAKTIAAAAVELYSSKEAWNKAQEKGEKLLKKLSNKEKTEKEFFKKIEETIQNLQEHRSSNFIGAMLQQHTMASTKYMSKWIEAKNKKIE